MVLPHVWQSGEACVAVAAFLFSVSSLSVKLTSEELGVLQICTLASGGCTMVIFVLAHIASSPLLAPTPKMGALVTARALCGALTILLYYSAVELASIKDATALFFTSPLFCLVLECATQRTLPKGRPLLGAVATVAGALLVSQTCFCALFPGSAYCGGNVSGHHAIGADGYGAPSRTLYTPLARHAREVAGSMADGNASPPPHRARLVLLPDLHAPAPVSFDPSLGLGMSSEVLGLSLALAAALTNALAFVSVRALKGSVPALSLTFWHHMATACAAVAAQLALQAAFASGLLPPGAGPPPSEWVLGGRDAQLVACVLLGQLLAQLLLNRGFSITSPTRGAAVNVLQVVFSFVWDYCVFGNELELPSLCGGVLIVLGVLVITSVPMQRMVAHSVSSLSRRASLGIRTSLDGVLPGGASPSDHAPASSLAREGEESGQVVVFTLDEQRNPVRLEAHAVADIEGGGSDEEDPKQLRKALLAPDGTGTPPGRDP